MPWEWSRTAITEKVPLQPLYSSKSWAQFQSNKMYQMKPGYNNRPEHWAVRIPEAKLAGQQFDPKTAGDNETAPQILIHKADEWGLAFTDGIHGEKPAADVLLGLRKQLEAWQIKDLPHGSPAFTDASLTFICLKERVNFNGGHGVRMIAQWTIEPELVLRGHLHYLFLGLSDDNTCQIIATFPVDVNGLPPEHGVAEHLGRSTNRYKELSREMDAYETDTKRWIIDRAGQLTPSLQTLDAMINSLIATHWS